MAANIFTELSLITITAVLVITIIKILKQPLVIGYIITGILVSPFALNVIKSADLIATLSEIGVALLLFLVGLNLNPKLIKEVGKVSLIAGFGQVVLTIIISYIAALLLGFTPLSSLYLGIAISFSSTIIITKLLSDKNDLNKLYGKISIGILIVQDIIAIFFLMIISSLSNKTALSNFAITTFATGAALVIALFLAGYYAIPKITKQIAKSQEFLFLFSLGWCFAIATLFNILNFSIEIGALLAGITLSISPYRYEISSKLKPIRDFFVFLFFIWLGSQLIFTNLRIYVIPIIVFSLITMLIKPIITIIFIGFLKYKKQTSFLTSITLAQISEFSLILFELGIKRGHIAPDMLSVMTIIGLITIAGSTYFILYGSAIYSKISGMLSIFERSSLKKEKEIADKKYEIILFGAHRAGHDILEAFKTKKSALLVVDYNPDIIDNLSKKGFNCIYGDISDIDLLDEIDLCSSRMVISTVPDVEANLLFIKRVKLCSPKTIVLAVANSVEDSFTLYNNGATYVITPKFIGGKYISDKIKSYKFDADKFRKEQEAHKKHLNKLKDESLPI